MTQFAGPRGGLIAEHEFTVELPKEDSDRDIDIPAAAKAKQAPEI